jgi:hypothetical protein
MHATNAGLTKKERKIRRKKLLRAYREDQQAIIWNKVWDEVEFCDLPELDEEDCFFARPDPPIEPEFEDFDEDYPNKIEILHNIHECD